ncbi:hypothetical protein [Cellulomonas sp. KRMCY2]|uniref:hypothetical protein n=1 Tax=Cellulomonas sp. KRMCY2 TaxID=1304865 RepID=UPI0012DC75C4|nr:hypothetical protein [Cellulomonas sp. KRMCY2]
MKTKTLVPFAANAASFVPRPAAPISALLQGTGVPAGVRAAWRRRDARSTAPTEHDSAREAFRV